MEDSKWLVTVGTTPFDSLIRTLDGCAPLANSFIFQIASGGFVPHYNEYFRYSDRIWAAHSGLKVICHCGAGTVYSLLESGIDFVAVPNLERVDPHQREMAQFLEANRYAPVCYTPEAVRDYVVSGAWASFERKRYQKNAFFKGEELKLLLGLGNNHES